MNRHSVSLLACAAAVAGICGGTSHSNALEFREGYSPNITIPPRSFRDERSGKVGRRNQKKLRRLRRRVSRR